MIRAIGEKWVRTLIAHHPAAKQILNDIRIALRRQAFYLRDFNMIPAGIFGSTSIGLDIGANRGDTLPDILKHCDQVIAFEPLQSSYKQLTRRFATDKRVELHRYGLSDESRTALLYTPRYNRYAIEGLATLSHQKALTIESAIHRDKPFYFYQRKYTTVDEESVTLRTLDSFHLAPSLMKIDVEGHEHAVLAGAAETISRHQTLIYMENNEKVYREWLPKSGYLCCCVPEGSQVLRWGKGRVNSFLIPQGNPRFDKMIDLVRT